MAEPLVRGLTTVRSLLLDDAGLVRAVGSGRRRGSEPPWRRVELRYVDLKAGRHLQVTAYDRAQAHIANHALDAAPAAVDALLDQPFGSWHVETAAQTLQLRVTKRGAVVHTAPREPPPTLQRGHDRPKPRLLPEGDPVLRALGIADERGRVLPSRQAKYRQVEELLRAVDAALAGAPLRTPTGDAPLHVVDLGCGNAYLTFAAHRYLTAVRGLPVRLTGVDVKAQSGRQVATVAGRLGVAGQVGFVRSGIAEVELPDRPDIVLALHACDTATDEALARAVRWEVPLVLAAPCCHHDLAAQLRRSPTPAPYRMLTRHGILRERFADTLTDALRASLLRQVGYRVEVVEFVESRHTPRNTLLRAVRTGAAPSASTRAELEELTGAWQVRPRLAELLGDRLG